MWISFISSCVNFRYIISQFFNQTVHISILGFKLPSIRIISLEFIDCSTHNYYMGFVHGWKYLQDDRLKMSLNFVCSMVNNFLSGFINFLVLITILEFITWRFATFIWFSFGTRLTYLFWISNNS